MRSALNIGHGSHTGKVRNLNEDYHRVWSYPFRDGQLLVFGVADGMGGAAAGEVASRLAIQVLDEAVQRYVEAVADGRPVVGIGTMVEKTARLANRRVHFAASEGSGRSGMGTTLTFVVLHGHRAWVGHVGDSRATLFREQQIFQLTRDHTWVAEQTGLGLLSEEEALGHEWRNLLTRVLGLQPEVAVDVAELEVLSGDVFIVSTDGLHGLVTADEMLAEIRNRKDAQSNVEYLLAQANARGGPDNITVVIVEVP